MSLPTFAAGASVVRRDVHHGRVWTAAAHRVPDDDGRQLTLASWPGVTTYSPTTWIEWLNTGDDATRKQGIPDLAAGRWSLGEWIWRDTAVLTWIGLDPDFSVQRFLPVTSDGGGTDLWKINFERPVHREPCGVKTFDLLLDLVVDPASGAWRWKDEDEYEQARALGVISDSEHRRVEPARERAIAFVEGRRGPLAQDLSQWRVPDDWALPILPAHAIRSGS